MVYDFTEEANRSYLTNANLKTARTGLCLCGSFFMLNLQIFCVATAFYVFPFDLIKRLFSSLNESYQGFSISSKRLFKL